jgi:hypothetical protein
MSSKYNITCHAWEGGINQFFVTADSTMWPCHHYSTAQINPENTDLDDDEYLVRMKTEDPHWNNIDITPLDDIINHDFFVNRVSPIGWASDNPPPMCIACCHKKTLDNA